MSEHIFWSTLMDWIIVCHHNRKVCDFGTFLSLYLHRFYYLFKDLHEMKIETGHNLADILLYKVILPPRCKYYYNGNNEYSVPISFYYIAEKKCAFMHQDANPDFESDDDDSLNPVAKLHLDLVPQAQVADDEEEEEEWDTILHTNPQMRFPPTSPVDSRSFF